MKKIKCFISHGINDMVIPIELSRKTKAFLKENNFNYVQDSPIKLFKYGSQVVVGGVGEVEGVVGYVEVDCLVFP